MRCRAAGFWGRVLSPSSRSVSSSCARSAALSLVRAKIWLGCCSRSSQNLPDTLPASVAAASQTALFLLAISFAVLVLTYGLQRKAWAAWPLRW